MAKQKFYVVWQGRQPGIYTDWATCKQQVDGVPQAKYKSFDTRTEAEAAYKSPHQSYVKTPSPAARSTAPKAAPSRSAIIRESISVDAACSGNPGNMEYQGVRTDTGERLFHVGPLAEGTNNIGEFLALVHALALLKQMGRPDMPIYSDSRNAQLWVKARKCRTKLERTPRNKKVFELIERAEQWLAVNRVTNPIIKWETDRWGEIPADFGRK